LSQFIALGHIKNWKEAKQLVEDSFGVKEYYTEEKEKWESAYEQFKNILQRKDF